MSFPRMNGGPGLPGTLLTAKEFTRVSLGQNIYWYELTSPLTATGSAVTINIDFDFPFKLIAIIVEHMVAAGTLGTDALTWSFNIRPRMGLKNSFPLVAYSASTGSQFLEIFGDDYVYPSGSFSFVYNTTNTDLINVVFIIQRREIE